MRRARWMVALLASALMMVGGATAVLADSPGNWIFPTAQLALVEPNCGSTSVNGTVTDQNGQPLNGVTVRVRSTVGGGSFLSAPSANGGQWGVSNGGGAVAGTWQIYVEVSGQEQSPIITVTTTGPNQCAPGSGGVQHAVVNFSQAPAGTPVQPQQPVVNPGLQFPYTYVTGTEPNCGLTQISGRLQNAQGGPVSGLAVRVQATDGSFNQLSPLADGNGNWSVTIANQAVANLYRVWVDNNGNVASNVINVQTTGSNVCQPGQSGVNTVQTVFAQSAIAPSQPSSGGGFQLAQPDPNLQFPTAAVQSVAPNCGTTNISGTVVAANGQPLNGVTVYIESDDRSYQESFTTVDSGNWGFNLGPRAVQGLWHLAILSNGVQESPTVNVQTNGPNQCAPGSGGVQTVMVQFTRAN